MTCLPLNGRSIRCGVAVIATMASGVIFSSVPSLAKHKPQLAIPSDPCAKMGGYLAKRIGDMKSLQAAINRDQSVPDTLAGVFDLMQGKPYADESKAQKLAEIRREANGLNEAMRVAGCTVVDIDKEMGKPATPTLPTAASTKKNQENGLETDIPIRSGH